MMSYQPPNAYPPPRTAYPPPQTTYPPPPLPNEYPQQRGASESLNMQQSKNQWQLFQQAGPQNHQQPQDNNASVQSQECKPCTWKALAFWVLYIIFLPIIIAFLIILLIVCHFIGTEGSSRPAEEDNEDCWTWCSQHPWQSSVLPK